MNFSRKTAIVLMLIHLVFVLFAFFRDDRVFSDKDFCAVDNDGRINKPFPLLLVSESYLVKPLFYFDSTYGSEFFVYDGTGGPCTYSTFNSKLPYSVILIVISSMVYYAGGFAVGKIISKIRTL